MNNKEFKNLLELHWIWQMGIFITEKKEIKGVVYYFGPINSEFFNLALPLIANPLELNLTEVKTEFEKHDRVPSFYITEDLQKLGFTDYLISKGYSSAGNDTWMVLDQSKYQKELSRSKVVEVTPEKFSDYYSVLSVVFSDFAGNEKYLEICKESISGRVTSEAFNDFKSELYLIYDNGKPIAGGGMFYSVEGNFAYLHDAGTLEEFRGKGYQTDLIRYRTNKALSLGITRIYSLVEEKSQSWKNMIKNGFEQVHSANIITLKNK